MRTITSKIEIDAAHRVSTHGSKCFNLHGHRYRIEATCAAIELHKSGVQTGMIIDFGFLKQAMMEYIHDTCDHATIWFVDDEVMQEMFGIRNSQILREMQQTFANTQGPAGFVWQASVGGSVLQTVPVNFIPTAENLAEWWYNLIKVPCIELSQGLGTLTEITVYETPNNRATYSEDKGKTISEEKTDG